MDDLKATVISCPAIRPIDYQKPYPVILKVNSSVIATGYILSQDDEDHLTLALSPSTMFNQGTHRLSLSCMGSFEFFMLSHCG